MAESEPENLVLHLLRDMRGDIADIREKMATKDDLSEVAAELRSEMHSLRADVASDLLTTRKELSEQIVGLRRAVTDYHSSVIGHGVLISELDERLRRVERRLGMEAPI